MWRSGDQSWEGGTDELRNTTSSPTPGEGELGGQRRRRPCRNSRPNTAPPTAVAAAAPTSPIEVTPIPSSTQDDSTISAENAMPPNSVTTDPEHVWRQGVMQEAAATLDR